MEILGRRLRERDRLEIVGMGVSVEDGLRVTWARSVMTQSVFVGEELAAVGGIGGALLSGVGEPWMLSTPTMERIPGFMLREGRRQVAGWLRIFSRLENYVDAGYAQSCR